MSTGVHVGQKKASGPLELELQAVLSHLIWMLGTKCRPSGKAVCALNP